MRQGITRYCAIASAVALLSSPGLAHKPSYTQGGHGVLEEAFAVADPDVSIVLYHSVTCEAPQLWLAFPIRPPYDLFVQLGVPAIDRLEGYRPSLALLAPGLPEPPEGLPFDVPEGYGAIAIDTSDVEAPGNFYEPFTQTSSWIVDEATYGLDVEATGYVVAWHPKRETGKLWVAIGTVEQFGPEDYANFEEWLVSTQTFHEVGDYAPEVEVEEVACEEPVAPEPAVDTPPATEPPAGPPADDEVEVESSPEDFEGAASGGPVIGEAAGCVTAPGPAPVNGSWGFVLLALVGVAVRSRQRVAVVVRRSRHPAPRPPQRPQR